MRNADARAARPRSDRVLLVAFVLSVLCSMLCGCRCGTQRDSGRDAERATDDAVAPRTARTRACRQWRDRRTVAKLPRGTGGAPLLALRADEQHLYVSITGPEGFDGQLVRVSKEDGKVTVLREELPLLTCLDVDEKYVYWTQAGSGRSWPGALRIPKAGGEAGEISADAVSCIAVDASYIWWVGVALDEMGDRFDERCLWRVKKSDTVPDGGFPPERMGCVENEVGEVSEMLADETGRVLRVNRLRTSEFWSNSGDALDLRMLASVPPAPPLWTITRDHVIWREWTLGSERAAIWRAPRSGGTPNVVAYTSKPPEFPPESLAADEQQVFWDEGSKVMCMDLPDGAPVSIFDLVAPMGVSDAKMLLEGDDLYWVQTNGIRTDLVQATRLPD